MRCGRGISIKVSLGMRRPCSLHATIHSAQNLSQPSIDDCKVSFGVGRADLHGRFQDTILHGRTERRQIGIRTNAGPEATLAKETAG